MTSDRDRLLSLAEEASEKAVHWAANGVCGSGWSITSAASLRISADLFAIAAALRQRASPDRAETPKSGSVSEANSTRSREAGGAQ